MKKALIVFAMLAVASIAMAHGPPSALDSGVMAQVSDDSAPPANGGGSGCITSHGGGSGWITSAASTSKMVPFSGTGILPNERMLN